MRNERVRNCRGALSVVIDEYSRFVGERGRGREGERERVCEKERERERRMNERRHITKRSQRLYVIDRKIRRALGVYLVVIDHAKRYIQRKACVSNGFMVYGLLNSLGWVTGCSKKFMMVPRGLWDGYWVTQRYVLVTVLGYRSC